MSKYKNSFIQSALEQMTDDAAAPPVTEVNIDSSKDAVAELMERNVQLENNNAELQEETFDNDVDAIGTVSDSVSNDLEEVVSAGAALESLIQLCNYTLKANMANKATVASLAFGLEQITDNLQLPHVMAALEADATSDQSPAVQTEQISDKASETKKSLGKRLIDGIKRIIGWIVGVIRNALSHSAALSAKATKLLPLIGTIDVSKQIDAKPFIVSLKLVEGAGDVKTQFTNYFQLSNKSLYGFFSSSFKTNIEQAAASVGTPLEVKTKLNAVLKAAMDNIYTESGTSADVSTAVPDSVKEADLTVGLTKPCIGGLQLFLAATLGNSEQWYCKAGVAKKELKFDEPDSIPVADKFLAKNGLELITKWVADKKDLEKTMSSIMAIKVPEEAELDSVGQYLQALSALVTGTAPHLLRLNMKNAASFVAYVDKSIAASKVTAKEEPAAA